jgi:hypothetical protein
MIFMAPILTCVFRDSKVLHRPASFVSELCQVLIRRLPSISGKTTTRDLRKKPGFNKDLDIHDSRMTNSRLQ